jgi:hypothetical protein
MTVWSVGEKQPDGTVTFAYFSCAACAVAHYQANRFLRLPPQDIEPFMLLPLRDKAGCVHNSAAVQPQEVEL